MNVLIYTRTSTREQELGHGAQETYCREYARSQGLTVGGVFRDQISGGVEVTKREGFCNLLEVIGKGDVLVVMKRDRLGRDLIQNAIAESLVQRKGARVAALDCPEGDDPNSVFMRCMIDALAQHERALIQERTRAALAEKRRKGEALGSPKRGYMSDEKGLEVINQTEVEAVERVKVWRQNGHTLKAIRGLCEQEGITTRRGTHPSIATLSVWTRGVTLTHPLRAEKRGPKRNRKSSLRVEDKIVGLQAVVQDLHARGLSQRAIVAELTQRGYRTKKGNPFTKTQVCRILARSPNLTQG